MAGLCAALCSCDCIEEKTAEQIFVREYEAWLARVAGAVVSGIREWWKRGCQN
uniref:Uncharacterized protein n=1 Tax=Candidatus Nitrotoga fabula TaxID=2182327 RepID=A0A2X0QV13_9PROT|nr:protein of unknown function [Candidatus Nitrotoga fabula]